MGKIVFNKPIIYKANGGVDYFNDIIYIKTHADRYYVLTKDPMDGEDAIWYDRVGTNGPDGEARFKLRRDLL